MLRGRQRPPVEDEAAPVATPDDELDGRQRAQLARVALGRLDRRDRAFFEECVVEERSPAELARRHGVALNTIYSRKFKLAAKLARLVRELERPRLAWA